MKVTVIVEDQVGACKHDPHRCLVAKAIERTYPGSDPSVGLYSALATVNGIRLACGLTQEATKLIRAYDDGEPVEHLLPMEMELYTEKLQC